MNTNKTNAHHTGFSTIAAVSALFYSAIASAQSTTIPPFVIISKGDVSASANACTTGIKSLPTTAFSLDAGIVAVTQPGTVTAACNGQDSGNGTVTATSPLTTTYVSGTGNASANVISSASYGYADAAAELFMIVEAPQEAASAIFNLSWGSPDQSTTTGTTYFLLVADDSANSVCVKALGFPISPGGSGKFLPVSGTINATLPLSAGDSCGFDLTATATAGSYSNLTAVAQYNMSLATATLLDPVPLNPGGVSLLTGSAISNPTILALQAPKARPVQGITTDGISQVVIEIPASKVGQEFSLTIDPSLCPTRTSNDCGFLFDPKSPPASLFENPSPYSFTVTAVSTVNGPAAYAAYRAPIDFSRTGNTSDAKAAQRSVLVDVSSTTAGSQLTIPITLLRPPIVLIHGIWSNPYTWDAFAPFSNGSDLYGRFPLTDVFRADYSAYEVEGIQASGAQIISQFEYFQNQYRTDRNVAATQFDVIAHSMGGLVVRSMSQSSLYTNSGGWNRGYVHKMLTLDTPHNGSQFASYLHAASDTCKAFFGLAHHPVLQNVTDLMPGSAFLQSIDKVSATMHIPAHAITGIANSSQEKKADVTLSAISAVLKRPVPATWLGCAGLLPLPVNVETIFDGVSDLIVSGVSESADGLRVGGGDIPTSDPPYAVIHTVIPGLFPNGPDVLGRNIGSDLVSVIPDPIGADLIITNHVIDLLNVPVTNANTYQPILP